jgi:hypothetical protein
VARPCLEVVAETIDRRRLALNEKARLSLPGHCAMIVGGKLDRVVANGVIEKRP